jgi:ABC-type Fe3+/spermidine/putrescine transport system ATPase subunit
MLDVINLDVSIDGLPILHGASLTVGDGERVAVLGPSGSGKSTMLRTIVGLLEPDNGDILWDGGSVLAVPTHQRGFGMMFQGYALFPHLTVGENVGFGLRMDRRDRSEVEATVKDALGWVGLSGFEDREVDGLSGGERQRVALARTLAPSPRLVLLDEPLGALDRNLREHLIEETKEILESRGATSIIVTHDRDEAVHMSDRLALMRDGQIVQTGTLPNLLANPTTEWVTTFLT